MEKKLVHAYTCILVVVGCLHIAFAEEKSNYVRSARSLEHLTDFFHLGHNKVSHTDVKLPIEIKPSHLVHIAPEFPVWKIHKYSGIQIKPVSTIPYIHVVEAKPAIPTFNLPIEHIQKLLGTTTEEETILTLKELASSEDGLKLMANYIKSEYPQSDISESDIVSTISQYKVKRPSASYQLYGPPPSVQIYGPTLRPLPPQQIYESAPISTAKRPPQQVYGLPVQPQPPKLQPNHSPTLKKFSPFQILKSTLPQPSYHLLTPTHQNPTSPSISHYNAPPQIYGLPQDIKYSQPQPLIKYEPLQPPKEYGPPPKPLPKVYGPPQRQLLKEYGPPQPRPPQEYRPPQQQSSQGPPQPQPTKWYGIPQPLSPRYYGPPQPQLIKEYEPPQPTKVHVLPIVSTSLYGLPSSPAQPVIQNEDKGEDYNVPETKDSSFIVKAEPIVVIDSQNTNDIMKEIAIMSAYGPPPTESPNMEVVESQDDKVEEIINSEEEQEDSNSKVETPKESYGPPKPYAPPAELPKPMVSVKTDEQGERSENEQNEFLTIPQENSDATFEFLPQIKEPEQKYGPPQNFYGIPKPLTIGKEDSEKLQSNEKSEFLIPPQESNDSSSEFRPHKTKEPEQKYGPPQIVYGIPKPLTIRKEDSEKLQSNEKSEFFIPPQESNDSSSEFRPQKPSNEPVQTYGPPQSFYVIPKPYSTDKENDKELQSNKQNYVFNYPQVSSDSSSNYHPFEEYGVPVETSPSKPVVETDKPVYSNKYPGYEPTSVGMPEAEKIHSISSSSLKIPDVLPMSMTVNGLKWTDFETGIHNLNDENYAIQPEKIITGVWNGSPELNLPSSKYQSQQSSFVPTYGLNKYMMAVQQDFYNTNIKPSSSGDLKVTQENINTNGRDVTALKYDHPNFSYTQLSKVQSNVNPNPSYTRISEIPLENNVNFQNAPEKLSSYGQPLSPYIFGEDSLPAASEKKISAVVPEYRKNSENGVKPNQEKTPEEITKGRKPVVKSNRDKPMRRRWMPMSKRKEESRATTVVYAETPKQDSLGVQS